MIVDKLENIEKYVSVIPDYVIEFMKGLDESSLAGHYELNNGCYANIDEYNPKDFSNCKFEAHNKHIDIQMVLSGTERIDIAERKDLKVIQSYDTNKDIIFFSDPLSGVDNVSLEPFKFVYIYPNEAHKPQIKTSSDFVKKVVVKIPIC